jgi:hypothetical protein
LQFSDITSTYSTENNPFQKLMVVQLVKKIIHRRLRNQNVHTVLMRVRYWSCRMQPALYPFKIHFNIILWHTPNSPKQSVFLSGFSTKMYVIFACLMRAMCASFLITSHLHKYEVSKGRGRRWREHVNRTKYVVLTSNRTSIFKILMIR